MGIDQSSASKGIKSVACAIGGFQEIVQGQPLQALQITGPVRFEAADRPKSMHFSCIAAVASDMPNGTVEQKSTLPQPQQADGSSNEANRAGLRNQQRVQCEFIQLPH